MGTNKMGVKDSMLDIFNLRCHDTLKWRDQIGRAIFESGAQKRGLGWKHIFEKS